MRSRHVHWIWLGSPVPDSLWLNIRTFRQLDVDAEYNYHLWTESPWHVQHGLNLQGLRLHPIEEAFARLGTFGLLRAQASFERERHGSHRNYPAASDIARYVILYSFGGLYLDADMELRLSQKLHDVRAPGVPKKSRSFIELTNTYDDAMTARAFKIAFASGLMADGQFVTHQYCNNALVAPAGHPLLLTLIQQLIARYDTDESYMLKRSFYLKRRVDLTITYTGVYALMAAANADMTVMQFIDARECFGRLITTGIAIRHRPAELPANLAPW